MNLLRHIQRNAVAYLALFVALGGTSYAAITLPKNSVGAKQIKKDAVRSSEVKDRSLIGKDFKPGHLPAGPQGPAGARGADGAPGATGARGPSTLYSQDREGTDVVLSGGFVQIARLKLPAGSYALAAQARIENVSQVGPANVDCFFQAFPIDATEFDSDFNDAWERVDASDGNPGTVGENLGSIELTTTLSTNGAADVRVTCTDWRSRSPVLDFIHVSAVQVDERRTAPLFSP